MQVAVQPQGRARPAGRGGGVLPDGADGVRVGDESQFGGLGELPGEPLGAVAQGIRTARSSPSRQSWLSQPRAPSRTG
ncbi:hypothetical protein [Nonomuraea sp. WAC 01424]|uniref:hypothetical protein n=1 Tax=Nonomuraea sp. WAC 01424 TaxID=2203200 RepID=UPI0021ADF5E7|nr:hypothetical protein [Nonomuraea sp. WAC 01424]